MYHLVKQRVSFYKIVVRWMDTPIIVKVRKNVDGEWSCISEDTVIDLSANNCLQKWFIQNSATVRTERTKCMLRNNPVRGTDPTYVGPNTILSGSPYPTKFGWNLLTS